MSTRPNPKKEDLPEAERHIYERMARERGTGHIWLAIANQPKILDAMVSLANALRNDTGFEMRYRQLGVLMVGLVTRCDCEFDRHMRVAPPAFAAAAVRPMRVVAGETDRPTSRRRARRLRTTSDDAPGAR